MTRAEQETVIRWDEESKTVHMWTASPVVMRKMAHLGFKPDSVQARGEYDRSETYKNPVREVPVEIFSQQKEVER